jgi:hypothetical protein
MMCAQVGSCDSCGHVKDPAPLSPGIPFPHTGSGKPGSQKETDGWDPKQIKIKMI